MSRRIVAAIILAAATAGALFEVLSARSVWIALRDSRPEIATIDYYGLGHITVQQVRANLNLKEGGVAPVNLDNPGILLTIARPLARVDSVESAESRLRRIPGVLKASVAVIQAEDPHRAALFVGIAETNTSRPEARFTGSATLPRPADSLYDRHSEAFYAAASNPAPDFDEDDSQGHAIFTDPKMKALENQAIAFDRSEKNLESERTVLHTSAMADQRRCAAWLLSYAPVKKAVAVDLAEALRDPDPEVRNIAARALVMVAQYANRNAAAGIRIAPAPVIEMLNSVVWTDRNKAMGILLALTETEGQETLTQLRQGSVPALTEMARWKSSYAEDAFRLLGRIAGLSDPEIDAAWSQGSARRERLIQLAGSSH